MLNEVKNETDMDGQIDRQTKVMTIRTGLPRYESKTEDLFLKTEDFTQKQKIFFIKTEDTRRNIKHLTKLNLYKNKIF